MMATLDRSDAPPRRAAALAALAALAAAVAACAPDAPRDAEARPGAPSSEAPGERPPPGPPLADPPPRSGGQTVDIDALGYDHGSPDAPVRILEFSDFGCGYCRQFHMETWPALRREYVETGKVAWKTVPFELGMFPNSRRAALAGECAGEQERFDAMARLLFERQREWKQESDPLPVLRELAAEAEVDTERFNRCMAQGWRSERVEASTALARRAGVRGTPTFFIVGFQPIPGAIPLETFREVIDTVYAMATRESAP